MPFRGMEKEGDKYSWKQLIEADTSDADLEYKNLSIYQVVYIAYEDKYLTEDKYEKWLSNGNNPKFEI